MLLLDPSVNNGAIIIILGFPRGAVVKNLLANAGDGGDAHLLPRSGRSRRGGNGNPQRSYSL